MASVGRRICICLLNVSEGRQKIVVEKIAKSALNINARTSSGEYRRDVDGRLCTVNIQWNGI